MCTVEFLKQRTRSNGWKKKKEKKKTTSWKIEYCKWTTWTHRTHNFIITQPKTQTKKI